jgi:hypothetical protein
MGSTKNMFAQFAQPRRDRLQLVLARLRVGMPLQRRHWFTTVITAEFLYTIISVA